MRSIQRRLGLGLAGTLLLAGLVLAQASLWVFDRGLRAYLEDSLRDEAQGLLTALVRGPSGLQLDERRLDPSFQRQFSGHYFRIDFSDRSWRSRSLWDRELLKPSGTGMQAELADGPQGQLLLIYRADYRRYGENLSISVAQDYQPILQSFRHMQWVGLGLGGAALLLMLLAQRYTVRRALRPLEQVRQQIVQLQQGRRSDLDAQVPEELESLVAQINHLLAHTEDTLKRSRNALGNLGHALKTPLAVLISLAGREELAAHPQLRASLREQLQQIEQRLSRELGRARLAGEVLPGARFDCAQELPGLFATLSMIHDRGLSLDWQAPPGLVLPRDREDLLELLGNLLDNACKWAAQRVQLTVEEDADGYRLCVDDDGPGIAAERRDAVLGRGTRLDEQVAGHGLGLGIVRDIIEAWNGHIELQDSPLGGLRVMVRLPRR
ncbi:HAMP domain-containing protein [Ectopseudomonas khazarica]|uniref:histidine kinase n=1 Tax=Ectopseudomonas oleovorans TaxID=301 RepID=A0A653AXN0_ECTOL|nr:ATP-binding protein [Pseudomonas khazarica]QTS84668.1 HAMP domain-containing protein [Pseudomonas khazarica]CAE6932524.1 Sensor protein kinase CarS [Pseudomonas oleovorans]HIQ43858.1 HAMP domain-containing protein [Pseudomonas oleovorans]